MHPLFNASELTDDKLYEKLGKAYKYKAQQAQLGHDPTVNSIDQVIAALEEEKIQRLNKAVLADWDKKEPNRMDTLDIGETEEAEEFYNEDRE